MKHLTLATRDGDLELDLDQERAQRVVNGIEDAYGFLTAYEHPPSANRLNGWPVFVTPEGDIRIEAPSRLDSRRLTVEQAEQLRRQCLLVPGVHSFLRRLDLDAVRDALDPLPPAPEHAPMPESVTVTVATLGGTVRLEVTPRQLAELLTAARDVYDRLPNAGRLALTVNRMSLGGEAV